MVRAVRHAPSLLMHEMAPAGDSTSSPNDGFAVPRQLPTTVRVVAGEMAACRLRGELGDEQEEFTDLCNKHLCRILHSSYPKRVFPPHFSFLDQ